MPSAEPQCEDDSWELKDSTFNIQVCAYGGPVIYAVAENLLKVDGTIRYHKEFNSLDLAIAFVEKKHLS